VSNIRGNWYELLLLIAGGVGCLQPHHARAEILNGLQFENVGELTIENIIASAGHDDDRKIMVIIQPLEPTVSDRTTTDPFTQAETYEKSVVVCNFQYYYGNLYEKRIALNPDMGFTPNVITYALRNSSTGRVKGLNTSASGILDAAQGAGLDMVISGYTNHSQTDSYLQEFSSRAEAEEAKWEICDFGGVTSIEVQPFEMVQVEGVGKVNPVDIVYVALVENNEFAKRRAGN
jgi:hypothetical protein